ncbi:mucin-17-like [Plectropomus leopardus]|uniref:mucin-17-like n=1 Tax=Plectropomus leopardus TaxID=160734 RepID=UPI001C4C26BA|nr:mucin-17-like [Plectropomus leopardus]
MSSGQSLSHLDAPVCRLDEEYFPEITLLDVTCDSTLPGSVPATPLTAGPVRSRFTSFQPTPLSYSTNRNPTLPEMSLRDITSTKLNTSDLHSPELLKHNRTTAIEDHHAKTVDSPEIKYAPERFLDFPEITLLDVTHDSELSQGPELSSMDATQDISPVAAEPGKSDINQSGELSSTLTGSVVHATNSLCKQSDKSAGGNVTQASLEATRDLSTGSVLENSRPSLEHSGQEIQTSAEDTFGTQPANITHDINSSKSSVQYAASEVSTSDLQCGNSSKLHCEPAVTDTVEANNEELLSSHDADLTSEVQQPSPQTAGTVNSTFTSLQTSQSSSSTDLNTTTQIPAPQNKTLDLPSSNENSPKAESEATDQATSVSEKTIETSLVNQSSSAVKASGECEIRNATFDRHSLQKSSGNTVLGEAAAATFSLQNNTFDTKPHLKQNGTITLSEISSSDSNQSTFSKSLKACNATSSPKQNKNENSQSGLPVPDGLTDTLGHQSMDMEINKANTFDLDDTLDLRADSLITSTPMPDFKILNINSRQEEGKILAAQKKLYVDGPSKPDVQVPSDVPSNIVCDRKTFLTRPAAKSLLPPSKAASQLLKHKPSSTLQGRLEPLTSGLPMTRQRAQAEALRNTAASDATEATTGISAYKLRASTTGFKQPSSGLQRPQLSGIPSGIQRAATGLRPPSTRGNTSTASSTNKLRAPAAANPVTKTSQAKKQPLPKGEALPIAKRKRMDPPLPHRSTEVLATSCDTANGTKSLKQPTTSKRALPAKTQKDDAAVPANTAAETSTSTSGDAGSRSRALKQPATSHRTLPAKPRGHGCAKCAVLEQQLKMKSEEIRRLKEELLKKNEQEEEY